VSVNEVLFIQNLKINSGRDKMFAKILYPTDFSNVSRKALEYVKKLREAGAKEVVVAHVIDEREIVVFGAGAAWLAGGVEDAEAELRKEMERKARKELDTIGAELREMGFDVRIRIESGSPFREILRIEEEENVSAVVIGSHGKSNVKEMLLGSVSENFIRHCKKPVLVVKR
jgi:nucleotide-binding universal stress UspA family protein